MSGVFPGSPDLAAFWRNLDEGRDLVGRPAAERWNPEVPEAERPWGGFVDGIDRFDARFFDISPREAELMDPQQRLFLQEVWHAIEDAGYSKTALAGTRTGLFVGVAASDYAAVLGQAGVEVEAYSATGNAHSVLANRVSFFFDLRGPSEAIDTACSSSLVAIHRAIESIRSGSCSQAIVGGVNALLSQAGFTSFTKAGMLSPDHRCRTFDARANGYVRGEGVGVIVLKPLAAAVRDGDLIRATILGSAENHGGRVQALTVPNPNAQAELLQEAFARSGVDAGSIGYIEAHGTGTTLGDPIEINGLKKAFASTPPGGGREGRCAVGSVKTNIGHLETAAGIAGIIKAILALQHRRIPGNVHLEQVNPYIQVDGTPFYFPRRSEPWDQRHDHGGHVLPRRVGVSSFGFGGANAHVVLEEAPGVDVRSPGPEEGDELFVFSAKDEERLKDVVREFVSWIGLNPGESLRAVARTLQLGREAMRYRLALVANGPAELVARLRSFLEGAAVPETWMGDSETESTALRLLRELHADGASVGPWFAKRELGKLAQLWVAGVAMDWTPLYGNATVRRVRLPGYPFAKVRHWPTARSTARPLAPSQHPLVGGNCAIPVSATLSVGIASAAQVLADHVVAGRPVLPGAAIIEIMDAAVRTVTGRSDLELRGIGWLQPAHGTAAGVRLSVRVKATSADGAEIEVLDETETVLARGTAGRVSPAGLDEKRDVEASRLGLPEAYSAEQFYPALAGRGLAYGEGYRAIRRAWCGPDEAVAEYALPESWKETGYRFHPGIIDGAFQTVALLGDRTSLAIPYALGRATWRRELPRHGWIHTRRDAENSFAIAVVGDDGTLCARFEGYALRRLSREPARLEGLVPTWEPVTMLPRRAASQELPGPVLVFDADGRASEVLRRAGHEVRRVAPGRTYRASAEMIQVRVGEAAHYLRLLREVQPGSIVHAWCCRPLATDEAVQMGVRSVHLLIQALLTDRREACPVMFVHAPGQAAGEAVTGYLKAARREHVGLRWKTIAADRVPASMNEVSAVTSDELRCVDGQWEQRSLRRWAPAGMTATALKAGGVYLVTGGAGALGRFFAEQLMTRTKANVVLAGRSDATAEVQALLARAGASARYVKADVGTLDGARAAVAFAKTSFGRLDGVLHAAGVLRDGPLWRKTWDDFEGVLRPKVFGAEALDEATRDERLDCFVLFSSVVGLLGNAGQCDYAFANAFLDAFARDRTSRVALGQRSGRTVAVNWPRWREGGMGGMAPAKDAFGLDLLEQAQGWEILEQALGGSEPQIWGFYGEAERIRRILVEPAVASPALREDTTPRGAVGPMSETAGSKRAGADAIQDELASLFAAVSKTPVEQLRPTEPLERYGLDSILGFEFSRRVSEKFGEVAPSVVYQFPTLAALSQHLADRLAARAAVPASVEQPAVGPTSKPEATAVGGPVTAQRSTGPASGRARRQVALAPVDYAFVAPRRLAMEVLYHFRDRLDFGTLRKGLARTADAFFPVNARLERRGASEYVIREAVDEADFLEIRDESAGVPVEGDVHSLAAYQLAFDPTQRGQKLARFRLHQLREGSALAVHVSHAIADGYSFYYFMSAWAAACRGEPFLAPDHSRHLLRGLVRQHERRPAAELDRTFELLMQSPVINPMTNHVRTLALEPAELIDEARRKPGPAEPEKLSENSVVTAHVWKQYVAALGSDVAEVTLACPVNFRRQSGRITPAFFGNASAPALLRWTRQRVLETSVPVIAAAITDAVRACDERVLASYHGAAERIRRKDGLEAAKRVMLADPRSALVVTNVARFPLPPMDFGTGAFTTDINLTHYAGTAVIVPGAGSQLKVRVAYPTPAGERSAVA